MQEPPSTPQPAAKWSARALRETKRSQMRAGAKVASSHWATWAPKAGFARHRRRATVRAETAANDIFDRPATLGSKGARTRHELHGLGPPATQPCRPNI